MEPLLPSEVLKEVLRWSLHAHEQVAANVAEGGPGNGKSPATSKLIEHIRFTRRFVPTYLAVLGTLVLGYAAVHWLTKLRRRQWSGAYSKHPVVIEDHSSTSSSSSSTLQNTPSPKLSANSKLEANEITRLLSQSKHTTAPSHHSILSRARCHLSSALAYQPPPIPAVTSPLNFLPQNSTTLLILLFGVLNVFYLFYHVPISIPLLFVFADRAGLLFVANLPALYILAAKTNQPLKLLTGWSYEGLNIFHRRLGEWMTVLGVAHSIGMFGVWYTLLQPTHFGLLRFLSTKLVLLGIFALSAYVAIWVTSTGYFRKLWYETFLGLHIFLQVAALVLLFFHHPGARIYVLASVGIWAVDRIVGRMILGRKKLVATLQVAEDGRTVLLYCDILLRSRLFGLNFDISNGWRPGQHVFVTVPGIGQFDVLQAHPFTIASPAPPAGYKGIWPIQLTIRAQDGFSKELLEHARLHQHAEIMLDGPYGSLDALDALHSADRKCLIAGGSGIAVTYPLAWSLLVQDDPNALVSTRTTYRNAQKHNPSLRSDGLPRICFDDRVQHLWINQHYKHRKWITIFPRRDALRSSPVYPELFDGVQTNVDSVQPEHTIEIADPYPTTYSTRDFADGGSTGRPDIALELRQWVEDCHSKEATKTARICVVVSGPDGLVRDVRNTAARLLREGWNIEVFVEKFGW